MSNFISKYNCPECKTVKLNAMDTGKFYYYKCPKCSIEIDDCKDCGKPETNCECGENWR